MPNPSPTKNTASSGLASLFDGSALVGLTDGELLARFVATRDEAAFEGLVARLGPMVLGVARRMLGDRGDADDAFQATFLVLVRRAGAVGRGELIGPWLHGVAVRVCRKARTRAARQRVRERTGVAVDVCPPSSSLTIPNTLDRTEIQVTIDDEIARLPSQYRRLVILCDVEGLTRDEAADRLGWTSNMVRGRLARARAQLRTGLVRRGCTPPSLAGVEGWVALPWLLSPPPIVVTTTARAALASVASSPSGRVALTLISSSALSLSQGVTRTMVLTSWKFIGASTLATATLAAGSGFLVAQSSAPADPQAPAPRGVQNTSLDRSDPSLYLVRPDLAFYLAHKEAFPGLTDTFLALYEPGDQPANDQQPEPTAPAPLTPDLLARIRAQQQVIKSQDPADPLVAKKQELIRLALEQVEHPDQGKRTQELPTLKALQQEQLRNARISQQTQQAFYKEGRITIDRLIDADRKLMRAEQAVATTPEERKAALQTFVDRVKEIQNKELIELEIGRATTADLAEAADALLEARILLTRGASNEYYADADLVPYGQYTIKRSPGGNEIVEGNLVRPTSEPVRQRATTQAQDEVARLNQARLELARKVFAEATRLYPGEMSTLDYLDELRSLGEAELAVATTPEARAAVYRSLITQTEQAIRVTEDLVQRGGVRPSVVAKMQMRLLELQARAASDATNPPTTADLTRRLTDLERKVDRLLDILDGGAKR